MLLLFAATLLSTINLYFVLAASGTSGETNKYLRSSKLVLAVTLTGISESSLP
ncbi:hypothetical protein D3C81_1066800 [compost metagenome]